MTEAELRSDVGKVRNVPNNTWELMKHLGFVEEAIGGFGEAEDDPVGYLVSTFDRIAQGAPSASASRRPKGRTRGRDDVPPQLTDYEIERSELFSEYLARQAAPNGVVRNTKGGPPQHIYPEVKRFRVKYLGDQLLSPEQARVLLTSPVAAHWSLSLQFKRYGVPVVGHAFQVTEGLADKRGPYCLIEVPSSASKDLLFKDRRPLDVCCEDVMPTDPLSDPALCPAYD